MSDALNNMYDDSVYDELIKDASVDKRVGKHIFLVTDVSDGVFPNNGDPYRKVKGVLTTAQNAKTDCTFSPPPPPDVVKTEKDNWEPKKLKGIANSIQLLRQLGQHYGKTPEDIEVGDQFEVQTGKSKVDKRDNSGGFIRVVAFLAPGSVGGQAGAASGNAAGF